MDHSEYHKFAMPHYAPFYGLIHCAAVKDEEENRVSNSLVSVQLLSRGQEEATAGHLVCNKGGKSQL